MGLPFLKCNNNYKKASKLSPNGYHQIKNVTVTSSKARMLYHRKINSYEEIEM